MGQTRPPSARARHSELLPEQPGQQVQGVLHLQLPRVVEKEECYARRNS